MGLISCIMSAALQRAWAPGCLHQVRCQCCRVKCLLPSYSTSNTTSFGLRILLPSDSQLTVYNIMGCFCARFQWPKIVTDSTNSSRTTIVWWGMNLSRELKSYNYSTPWSTDLKTNWSPDHDPELGFLITKWDIQIPVSFIQITRRKLQISTCN